MPISNGVELHEAIRKQLEKMSTATMRATFSATATHRSSFTGLRAALDAEKWKFGTVHRNRVSDERVMVVGPRQVIGIRTSDGYRRGWDGTVGDTVEDWFDYWEVEPET